MGAKKINYDIMSDLEILELFKEKYREVNPKDANEYIKLTNNTPSLYIIKKRLGLKYSDICKLCGFTKKSRSCKDRVLLKRKQQLLDLVKELGYIPSRTEFHKINNTKCVQFYGMSYRQFVKFCGLNETEIKYDKINNYLGIDDEYYLTKYKKIVDENGTISKKEISKRDLSEIIKRFGSLNKFKIKCEVVDNCLDKRKYSQNKITELLIHVYEEFGERLSYNQVRDLLSIEKDFPKSVNCCLGYYKKRRFDEVWEYILDERD